MRIANCTISRTLHHTYADTYREIRYGTATAAASLARPKPLLLYSIIAMVVESKPDAELP